MDREISLSRVRNLIDFYNSGQIPRLAQHEVHPDVPLGSRENYLYFTLPVCINFQRSSPAMWQAALATFSDPETNYLFYPEKLAETAYPKIQADLQKHRLGLQPNKHTHIWTTIAATLHNHFHDDPRELIETANHSAAELITLLQITRRADFPFLSGPKLSNYWPFILSHYTDVNFTDMEAISIIPDTHIIQSTVHLGLATNPTALETEAIWRELLKDSGISPVTVHPVLWNWSRAGFLPEV